MQALVISKIKLYSNLMRLNKPIGIFLLLWPTLWALWIAADGRPTFRVLSVFILGVVIMRSAGCVINDMADHKFDGFVERTKTRPIVREQVKLIEAFILFLFLCGLGFLIALQLNQLTIKLSFVAVLLAIIYPFTKRVISFPQVILGAAFAWSVPMAFAAQINEIPLIAWVLYIISILWPVAYDSIYALMDREEDLKIGVKSTAILFGNWDIMLIMLIQGLVIISLLFVGLYLKMNVCFYIGLFIASLNVTHQYGLIKSGDVKKYYRAFYSNHWLGLIIFIGIVFGLIKFH